MAWACSSPRGSVRPGRGSRATLARARRQQVQVFGAIHEWRSLEYAVADEVEPRVAALHQSGVVFQPELEARRSGNQLGDPERDHPTKEEVMGVAASALENRRF